MDFRNARQCQALELNTGGEKLSGRDHIIYCIWKLLPWREVFLAGRAVDQCHANILWHSVDSLDGSSKTLIAASAVLQRLPNLFSISASSGLRGVLDMNASPIYDVLPHLVCLRALSLSWCRCDSLKRLPAMLLRLDLSWSGWCGNGDVVQSLHELHSLEELNLTGSVLPGYTSEGAAEAGAALLRGVVGAMPGLRSLNVLQLSFCHAGDEAVAGLVAAPFPASLRRLDIEGNGASSSTLRALASLPLQCDALEAFSPTQQNLDGTWAVVAGASAGEPVDFWRGAWCVVSGNGSLWRCIMPDGEAQLATMTFEDGMKKLHSERCDWVDVKAMTLMFAMSFPGLRYPLLGMFKFDPSSGVLVAARTDSEGVAPSSFADVSASTSLVSFVRVQVEQSEAVRHPITGCLWDLQRAAVIV